MKLYFVYLILKLEKSKKCSVQNTFFPKKYNCFTYKIGCIEDQQ